jgi:hypothetical protein
MYFQNATYGLPHHREVGVFNASEPLSPGEHQYANPVYRTAVVSIYKYFLIA